MIGHWSSSPIRIVSLAFTFSIAVPVSAQTGIDPLPPASIGVESPGNVNMSQGTFSESEKDLQIGGEGSEGLSLIRSYNSGMSHTYSIYAGFRGGTGWTHNWAQRVTVSEVPRIMPDPRCEAQYNFYCNQYQAYFHSVVAGDDSFKFQRRLEGGELPTHTGSHTGTFSPIEDTALGSSLHFNGTLENGNFTLITKAGANYAYRAYNDPAGMALDRIVHPDGTINELHYAGNAPALVKSTRGYALVFEYGGSTIVEACAINLVELEVDVGQNCPDGVPTVKYTYGVIDVAHVRSDGRPTVIVQTRALVGAHDLEDNLTGYSYDDGGHVDCITAPGQSTCRVRNYFTQCILGGQYDTGHPDNVAAEMHLSEQVIRQVFADGSEYIYQFGVSSFCPDEYNDGLPKSGTFWFENSDGGRTTLKLNFGSPVEIEDPLGRITQQSWSGPLSVVSSSGLMRSHTYPDGRRLEFDYDDRGNIVRTVEVARPGSGDVDLVTTATYPSCTSSNRKVCNKPSSVTDAGGAVTNYDYDPAHGGLLRRTLPPDSAGIRPETRYSYVQKHAWVKSGGGFVQEPSPVWVLAGEEYCRTSAADAGGNCAAGPGDEVVTTYEYEQGSSTKGSNILMTGMAVSADGQTLRTCYGYDDMGRRISETPPAAGLASCP